MAAFVGICLYSKGSYRQLAEAPTFVAVCRSCRLTPRKVAQELWEANVTSFRERGYPGGEALIAEADRSAAVDEEFERVLTGTDFRALLFLLSRIAYQFTDSVPEATFAHLDRLGSAALRKTTRPPARARTESPKEPSPSRQGKLF